MAERTYRIHVAAERSGVSEGLIRAWERRYAAVKPKRTASGYRAYTEADIGVLKRLKALTEEGVAIAEAVALVPRLRRDALAEGEAREGAAKAPRIEAWRADVLRAASQFDQQAVEATLDEAMTSLPPVAFADQVLLPLQREVGDRWHAGAMSVAEEHLVTQAVRQRLMTLIHQAPRRAKAHVVCACFPEEDHEAGLLAVALRFRHAGWRVTFLGARTPAEYLARVVVALRPEVVALSCVNANGAEVFSKTLERIVTALPKGCDVVVGGATADANARALQSLGCRSVSTAAEWKALLRG